MVVLPGRRTRLLAFLVGLLITEAVAALVCPDLERATKEIDSGGFPGGLLWRIESDNGAENYIFGTIHIADSRVTQLDSSVADALRSSPHFMMEVMLDIEAVQRMARAMHFTDGGSLSHLLDRDLFERAVELLGRYGVTREAANTLRPWAAYTTLSLPPGQNAPPLDLLLMNEATATGKSAAGLETLDEQVAVFNSLSDEEQVELLTLTICHYATFQSEVEEMITHYEARDLAAMMRMSVRYESALQDRFMDLLLRQRNFRMVDRMRPRLDAGGSFIAIGALHLPGREGVLNLLQTAGYRVTRVF